MPRYESPYDPKLMPTGQEHIIYEKKGNVAYVTINRPHVRNALHSYAYAELRSCWRDIGLVVINVPDAPGVFDGLDVTIVVADFGVRS